MAQYKVLQDIEAEDKLLGPLSMRQFIYAVIVVAMGFVTFQLFVSGVWFIGIFFVPPILFFALLAAPFGHDQSSELWMLAKIRYWIFPRKRIWNQSGIQELVTITVPKQIEKHLTKDFDREEAKSRLTALASTLDTRGWAIKNAVSATSGVMLPSQAQSDRLIDIDSYPAQDPMLDIKPSDDLLDSSTNPTAMQMGQRLNQSTAQHKQELLDKMQQMTRQQQQPPAPQQFPQPPAQSQFVAPQTTAPQSQSATVPAQPAALPNPQQQKPQPIITRNDGTPLQKITPQQPSPNQSAQTMTDNHKPDILKDVKNSQKTSMNVSHQDASNDDGEVVISLH